MFSPFDLKKLSPFLKDTSEQLVLREGGSAFHTSVAVLWKVFIYQYLFYKWVEPDHYSHSL